MPILNTCADGAVNKFLKAHFASKGGEVTHTLFTGGSYRIDWKCRSCDPNPCIDVFRQKVGEELRYGCMPCLTEQHTPVFPLYVDVDLKVPAKELTDDTVRDMVTEMNRQLRRFYPDAHDPNLLECLVCTKSKPAVEVEPGLHKMGVHLHWPQLLVQIDSARQMRHSLAVALDKRTWKEELGVERVDWDDALDDSVYRTGLRMVGAPKATRCTNCTKRDHHGTCHLCGRMNNFHVIDESVYVLRQVFVGGDVDDERRARYAANPTLLVRKTTVRSDEESPTPGYRIFDGCSIVPDAGAGRGGRKRKATDDSGKVGIQFRRQAEVTNPRVHEVARAHLVQHSPHYAESRMNIRFDGKMYKVLLTGDGAGFCLNKGSSHRSQHVYMEILKGKASKSYESRMRCWCTKMVVRSAGGVVCKDFYSRKITLKDSEASRLFAATTPTAAGSSSRDRLDALDKKLEELEG